MAGRKINLSQILRRALIAALPMLSGLNPALAGPRTGSTAGAAAGLHTTTVFVPRGMQEHGFDMIGQDANGHYVGTRTQGDAKVYIGEDGNPTTAHGPVTFKYVNPQGRTREKVDEMAKAFLDHPLDLKTDGNGRIIGFAPHVEAGPAQVGRVNTGKGYTPAGPHYTSKPVQEDNYVGARVIDGHGNSYEFHNPSSTFTASQINQAVCSGTCGTDAFNNLKTGQPTPITFAVKDGIIGSANNSGLTTTATVTKLANGKFEVSSVGAREISTALKGTSNQIDAPRDAGFTVTSASAASYFDNGPTGTGRILSVPNGATLPLTLTARGTGNGQEQQVNALVYNDNGTYHIIGTKATPTKVIEQLTGYNPNASCTCTSGTYQKQPYHIVEKPEHKYEIHGNFKTHEEVKVFLHSVAAAGRASGLPGIGLAGININDEYIDSNVSVNGQAATNLYLNLPPLPVAPGKGTGIVYDRHGNRVVTKEDCTPCAIKHAIINAGNQAHIDADRAHQDATDQLNVLKKMAAKGETTNRLIAGGESLLALLLAAALIAGAIALGRRRGGPAPLGRPGAPAPGGGPNGGGTGGSPSPNASAPSGGYPATARLGSSGANPAGVTSADDHVFTAQTDERLVVDRAPDATMLASAFAGLVALIGGIKGKVASLASGAKMWVLSRLQGPSLGITFNTQSANALSALTAAMPALALGYDPAQANFDAVMALGNDNATVPAVADANLDVAPQPKAPRVRTSKKVELTGVALDWKMARAAIREWKRAGAQVEGIQAVNEALTKLGNSVVTSADAENAALVFRAARYVMNKTIANVQPQFRAARVEGVLEAAKAVTAKIDDVSLRGQAERYVAKMEKPTRSTKVVRLPAAAPVRDVA